MRSPFVVAEMPDRDRRIRESITMQSPVHLIPSALGELFAEVNQNGYITEKRGLKPRPSRTALISAICK
ncbi:hypothetical protein [Microcoleus sp. D2_18a_D3]|uniref:hypothetical protein n=1 Tax=Microcoleus sp. D2_18a_D3 TaxID=3055330 RepID=UPI002FD35272